MFKQASYDFRVTHQTPVQTEPHALCVKFCLVWVELLIADLSSARRRTYCNSKNSDTMRMHLSSECGAIEVFLIYLARLRQATKPKSIETLHGLIRAWRSGKIQMKVRHTEGDALSPWHVPDVNRWSRWIVCLLLLSCFSRIDPAAGSERPNVVLILADDQSYRDFGFMGNDLVHTPHLDELARTSARYPNGYTPMSVCRPSLATLLTGLYPHQHGIHFNHPPPGLRAMRDLTGEQYRQTRATTDMMITRVPTLPRILARHGYACLQTGKHWEGSYKTAGFTDGMTLAKPSARLNPITGTRQQENGDWVAHGNGDSGLTIGRETMKPIERFVADHSGERPFMVWYAPFLPHTPFDAPQRFHDLYSGKQVPAYLRRYYAEIARFDETVGQLLEILAKHQATNTLVVLVSDNGFRPDQRRHDRQNARSKLSSFEDGIRTPILLRWPGHTKPADHRQLVGTTDLVPTILNAVGLGDEITLDMKGINLLPSARGEHDLPDRPAFGAIYPNDARQLDSPSGHLRGRWIRHGNYKLILAGNDKTRLPDSLFDLRADPDETDNLFNDENQRQRITELTRMLDRWWDVDSKHPPGSVETGSVETGSAETGSAKTGSAETGSAETGR